MRAFTTCLPLRIIFVIVDDQLFVAQGMLYSTHSHPAVDVFEFTLVILMYLQSGGKTSAHSWLSDSTNIGAISYLVMQTYKYTYHRIFQTIHQ